MLPNYLDDNAYGPEALAVLADMGNLARRALPELDKMINRITRVTVYLGDQDREMRTDERLLAASIVTRDRILAGQPPVWCSSQ